MGAISLLRGTANSATVADYPEIILYISLAVNTAGSWFKLSVFGELR